jgi:hypothetical protein
MSRANKTSIGSAIFSSRDESRRRSQPVGKAVKLKPVMVTTANPQNLSQTGANQLLR